MSAAAIAFRYDAEGTDCDVALRPGMAEGLGEAALLWIDLPEPDDAQLEEAARAVGFDERLLDVLRRSAPRFLVANYGDHQHFSVSVPPPEEADSDPVQLDFVVGESWLVTVHRGRVDFIQGFREQDKGETQTGALSGAAFAASLLDWFFEVYFNKVADIEEAIDELDDRILVEPSGDALLKDILKVRRRIAGLRRLLAAQRPVFYGLERPDVIAGSKEAAPHAARLIARYERALDEVEHARDLVLGSFELLASRTGQLTNELVKALTFFTVIIGGAAAVAGLFGMNFTSPFFKSGNIGFLVVVGGLVALSLVAFGWARHRRWV